MIYAKPRQYLVTDSRGQAHKRKSARVYTHVTVAYRDDRKTYANWHGRKDLADAAGRAMAGRLK